MANKTLYRKPVSRARGPRAAPYQIHYLIEYMIRNRDFANGQLTNGREAVKQQWKLLVDELNSLGKAQKSVEQWKTTWRDLKNHTTTKFRHIINARIDDNVSISLNNDITDIDRKMLTIMGYCCNENLIVSSKISPETEETQEFYSMPSQEEENSADLEEVGTEPEVENDQDPIRNETGGSSIPEEQQFKSEIPTLTRKPTKKRRNRLRNKFLTIAELQARNMNIFAQAMDKMATAVQQIASATDKFAEAALLRARNEEARIALMTK